MRGFSRGSSLVEVIVATGVMALVLTAVVAGLTLSLRTNAEAGYRSEAVKLSQAGMEVFRRERALRGWDGFVTAFTSGATYCLETLPAPEATFTSGACDEDDGIVVSGIDLFRKAVVTIDSSDPDDIEVRVAVGVTWDSGQGEQDVSLIQTFRQWD
jgi:hypothetical protein